MSRLLVLILYAFSFLLGRKRLVAFFLPRFFSTSPASFSSSSSSSSYQRYYGSLQRHGSSSSAAANVEDFGVASRAAQSQMSTQVQDGSRSGGGVSSSGSDKQHQQPWRKSTERRDTKFKSSNSRSKGYEEKARQVDKVLAACRAMVAAASDANANATLTSKLAVTEANHAIITAGRIGRLDDAMEIFRVISDKSLGLEADLMSFNNAIWSAGNGGQLDMAKRIFSKLTAFSDVKMTPNVYTYGSLMHGCAKAKAYKQALVYLDKMLESGITPNAIVFTSAMEACAEAGQHREAIAVMDRMVAIGLKPDLTMVNAAIKACSLAGAMEEADALAATLREYGSMDVFTYHTLMMGNTKLSRYQRVLSLYEEALESSAQLDGGVYSLAMLSALNCGLYQQVPRIAERARNEGVALTEASYTILIQALAEAGAGEQAVKCLDVMRDEGLVPNVISYAAAMAASRDKPAVVIELLERMERQGVEPNTVLLTTAINSLAREGGSYADMAFDILEKMEKDGPEPNIYTYNTVTRAFAEAGRLSEALAILSNIKKRGLMPDRFTFTTLLMACGRTNSSDEISGIMATMRQAGVVPDEIAFGAAIDAHRRANNSLRAVECLHDMYRSKIEPTAAHYNLVLRTFRAEGYVDKMFKMVMAISAKEGAKINSNTFELVIEAQLEADKWKEALLLLKSMEDFSFRPSLQIYVSLVEKLERARQYKAVLSLYRAMVQDGYDFYENPVLNGVFKRLVSAVGKSSGAGSGDIVQSELISEVASTVTVAPLPTSQVLEELVVASGAASRLLL